MPYSGQVVQEEWRAVAEQMDYDVGVGEVAIGAKHSPVAWGVALDREQSVQHYDVDCLGWNGGCVDGGYEWAEDQAGSCGG